MKFKKLRKTISLTDAITLDITEDGKYLGYISYKTIGDVPDKYNKYKVTRIYTRASVVSDVFNNTKPFSYLCAEVEVK